VLQPLRAIEPASADVRARARSRLMSAVASAGTAGAPGGTRAERALLSGKAGVAVLAFLVGAGAGAALYGMLRPAPAPRVVYLDRPAARLESSSVAPAPAPVAEATSVASPGVPASVASTGPARAVSRVSQLAAERTLLDEARTDLSAGDPSQALDLLERHRRTFPAPILGEERDALRVEALAKQGRGDEARTAAAAFRKRWPDSLFSSAVDDAVHSVR
jgi:hypothetical protein